VDEALTVIVTAAELLGFRGLTELENRLWDLNESLRLLASAGELIELSFQLEDEEGVYGVRVLFDPYGVEDYAEVDLSSLRLLASAEACGQLHIVCLDSDFVQGLVGTDWLPEATDTLTVALSFNTEDDSIEDPELTEEESDDDDNKVEY
jgi:hypothetical protein